MRLHSNCKSSWVNTIHSLSLRFFWWCAFYIIAHHLPFPSSVLAFSTVLCLHASWLVRNHAWHGRNTFPNPISCVCIYCKYVFSLIVFGLMFLIYWIKFCEFAKLCVCVRWCNKLNCFWDFGVCKAYRLLHLAQSTGYTSILFDCCTAESNRVDSADRQATETVAYSTIEGRIQVSNNCSEVTGALFRRNPKWRIGRGSRTPSIFGQWPKISGWALIRTVLRQRQFELPTPTIRDTNHSLYKFFPIPTHSYANSQWQKKWQNAFANWRTSYSRLLHNS